MFEKSTSDARPHNPPDANDAPPPPKPANPEHIRLDFYRLTLDWVHLHNDLPRPVHRDITRRPKYREYGHPAEWPSDKAAQIADLMWSWHDMLAEHRGETPPPPAHSAEIVRVTKAWQYLEPRIEQLVDLVEPDAFTELRDLHHQIRAALGHTNPRQVLPMPCPGQDCNLRTLTRRVAIGKDLIICGACGYTVREEYYPMLVRIAIDAALNDAA